MSCATCSAIPDSLRCYNERESLPATTNVLERYKLELSADLWECPACHALFVYESETSQSGSGNNDEDRLTRLGQDENAILSACLHRGEASVKDTLRRAENLLVEHPHRRLLLTAIREKDAALAHALLPRLVRAYAGGDWQLSDHLKSYAWARNKNPALLLQIVEKTRERLDEAAEYARQHLPK